MFKGFCGSFFENFLLFKKKSTLSQLSRTWKNRYQPILPGLFYIELRRAFVGKLS